MEEDFRITLQNIDKCKTMQEITELRKYVKDTFYGYNSNTYFWHCRDRFNKVLHKMKNNDLIL